MGLGRTLQILTMAEPEPHSPQQLVLRVQVACWTFSFDSECWFSLVFKLEMGTGEMAQWARCLLPKQDDLSSTPKTHVKSIMVVYTVSPSLEVGSLGITARAAYADP